jgi:two-component system, cell cycle sensor histidine kinase and response regulator CckA
MSPSGQLRVARAKRSILVVDDDILILEIIRRILEPDFSVVTSGSGQDALTMVEHGRVKPDLVLTDLVMPGPIDGLTLAKKIRHRDKKILVLFMTGVLSEYGRYTAEIAEKGLLLQKPFSREQLFEFIDRHCGKQRPERPT